MSEMGERLTDKGAALAAQARVVINLILHSDFDRRGGRRKFQERLLAQPLIVELREAAPRKPSATTLAAKLLAFYEQSLAILITRAENSVRTEKGMRLESTQSFWNAQQEIKRAVLGRGYEEHKFLGIFVGLDFLAGQKVRDESEFGLKELRNALQAKIETLSPRGNPRKETTCSAQAAQV